jgi:glyoxylase-like metal-dependent hydrolase (beta-lactamase superfamily II)
MVTTIDCNYIMPQVAAAYLLHCGDKACFIDNNTNHCVPDLLKGLADSGYTPEQVEYIIITHVHLDHAGGTGLLLRHCPNAKVVAHPRAAPHVIDPSRLVKSAQEVYGEIQFRQLYGEIIPVPEDRVVIPSDGETLKVGDTELTFIYTRGHANHHFVIVDRKTKSVFTGDSFGLAYPIFQGGAYPFLFPSTSPTDFDPHEARISYDKILHCDATQAYLTHFGVWHDIPAGYKMLCDYIDYAEQIFNTLLAAPGNSPETDYKTAYEAYKRLFDKELAARGIELNSEEEKILELDLDLNAQGVAFAAQRARKKGKQPT